MAKKMESLGRYLSMGIVQVYGFLADLGFRDLGSNKFVLESL